MEIFRVQRIGANDVQPVYRQLPVLFAKAVRVYLRDGSMATRAQALARPLGIRAGPGGTIRAGRRFRAPLFFGRIERLVESFLLEQVPSEGGRLPIDVSQSGLRPLRRRN